MGGDSVILSDDSPKTLPVKDLTTNTVRIKLDQKKANKVSPLKKLQEKITRQGQEQEDSTEEWFKITDISFRTGLLKTLEDGSNWNIKLCVKPVNNVNEGLMSFEQLENFLLLCHTSKESEDINVSPLLNYLKPFFSFDDWQISELNARLKYLKKGGEEEIIQPLLNDELNLSRLDQNCLENFKDFCLKAICGFSFEGLKQACSESEVISHSDESTTKTLQSIVKALTKIFPEEKDYKKDLDVCMFNELRKRLKIGTTGSQKVDILCSIITNQVSKINYILDNFGNFALNIWCPNMSENLLKLILPMLGKIIHSKIHWSEDLLTIFKNLSTLNHIHCNDKFSGFQVSPNSQNEPNLGDIFEPLLAMWTEELAAKARNEMQRLYEIQKEEKKENDLKDTNAEDWKAFDQTKYIQGIFLRSHTEWHAKCKDNGLSAKQTDLYSKLNPNDLKNKSLTNLYSSLVYVLYEYKKQLAGLILEDNRFDKSEFIMVINCMHGSVDYLNDIFKMYEDEIFFRLPTELEMAIERQNGHEETPGPRRFHSKLNFVLKLFCEGKGPQ